MHHLETNISARNQIQNTNPEVLEASIIVMATNCVSKFVSKGHREQQNEHYTVRVVRALSDLNYFFSIFIHCRLLLTC